MSGELASYQAGKLESQKKSYKRIESLKKADQILKFLANQKEASSTLKIAQAVNIPKDTVMCHLITAEELGWVISVGDNWRIGMGLALIWARVKANMEDDRIQIDKNLELLTGGGSNGE